MSLLSAQKSPSPSSAQRLTVPFLIWFSLPLALTFLMMSGAAPLVSNGIAWAQGADGERIHLSAFLLTFATALFIYSPMFIARNVAIRVITGRRSLWAYAFFFVSCAVVSSVILVVVSQVDQCGHFIFSTLLGTSDQTEALARQGLIVFVPIPILVAIRGMAQGCHINNDQTWYVGIGTALRLTTMAVFVFGYAVHHELTGPILGALTYLTGIGVETVFVLVTLIGKPQLTQEDNGPVMRFGDFLRYAGPLILGSMAHQLSGPVLIVIINRAYQPAENASSYNLIRDTAWIMVSMLMTIQAVVISHATCRRNLRIIIHFSAALAIGITAVAAALALTPLRELIFVTWLRVDNQIILSLTFTALVWLLPLPIITLLNHFMMALHTRSGRTVWVTAGNIIGLAMLACIALMMDLSSHKGVVLAVICHAGFQLVSALTQAIGLLRGGVRATLDPTTMAEKMQPGTTLPNPQGLKSTSQPAPAPEHVQA